MSARTKYINVTSSNVDNILFVSSFVGGIAWILFTRLIFDLSALIAVVGPLVSLGVYARILRSGKFQLREDRAADNLYYLGFLFTLASLGVGLYKYDSAVSGVENIISDLGVGLTSTIAGLFLRILFLQLRVDPDEVSEDAKERLNRAIESFQVDVRNIAEVSRQAQTILAQQFQENAEIYKASVAELTAHTKKLATQVTGFNTKLGNIDIPSNLIVTKVEEACGAFVKVVNEVAIKLSGASDRVKSEFDSLSLKVSSIRVDDSRLLKQVDEQGSEIAQRISNTVASLEPLGEVIYSLLERFNEVASTLESVAEHSNFATKIDQEFVGALQALNGNVAALNDYSSQLRNLPTTLISTVNDIRSVGEALSSGSLVISQNLDDAAKTVKAVEATAVELSSGLRSVTKELTDAVKEIIEIANGQ